MSDRTAREFINALRQVEDSGDVEALVRVFDPSAELENPIRTVVRQGEEGVRRFWTEYRSAFGDVRSEFLNVKESDGLAVLEWQSKGTLNDGQPICYRGVSLLEMHEGKVSRFRTYYDSAAFLPGGSKHVGEVIEH